MFAFARTGAKALLIAAGTAGFVALGAGVASADLHDHGVASPGLGDTTPVVSPTVPLTAEAPEQVAGALPDAAALDHRDLDDVRLPLKAAVVDGAAGAAGTAGSEAKDLVRLPQAAPAVNGAEKKAEAVGAEAEGLADVAERPEETVRHLRGTVRDSGVPEAGENLSAKVPDAATLPQDATAHVDDAVDTVQDKAAGGDVHHQVQESAPAEAEPVDVGVADAVDLDTVDDAVSGVGAR